LTAAPQFSSRRSNKEEHMKKARQKKKARRPTARLPGPVPSEPVAPVRTSNQVAQDWLAALSAQKLIDRARASALIFPLWLEPGGIVCECDPQALEQCPHRNPPPSERERFIVQTDLRLWGDVRRTTDTEILRRARHLQEENRGVTRLNKRQPLYDRSLVRMAHAALVREGSKPIWAYAELSKALNVNERTIRRLIGKK
jgi:hypothetical protein